MGTIIIGTGTCLPERAVQNTAFLNHTFYKKDGERMLKANLDIVEKMQQITGIKERRYILKTQDTADIAYEACIKAIEDAGIDQELFDAIIIGHNFGNIVDGSAQSQNVPNLAAVVKNKLGIKNHKCIAFDILFGCPGWVQAMIQAEQMIKAGDAKYILVVGTDILSRVLDQNDLDVMLFGDGAGATVLKYDKNIVNRGILCYLTYSHCQDEIDYIYMGEENHPEKQEISLKMNGRNVYKYAVSMVPEIVTECLEKAGVTFTDVSKFIFHQANEKMNIAIGEKLSKLHNQAFDPSAFPMTMQWLGNTSAATVPTLLDLILKGDIEGQEINEGDLVVFSSVGAGMHTNCILYRF